VGQANSLTYKLTKKTTTPDDINSKAPQLQKPLNQNIINLKVHQNSKAPQLQSPLTQNIINSKAYQLKKSPTQKLKYLSFILHFYSNFRSVLAKIRVIK